MLRCYLPIRLLYLLWASIARIGIAAEPTHQRVSKYMVEEYKHSKDREIRCLSDHCLIKSRDQRLSMAYCVEEIPQNSGEIEGESFATSIRWYKCSRFDYLSNHQNTHSKSNKLAQMSQFLNQIRTSRSRFKGWQTQTKTTRPKTRNCVPSWNIILFSHIHMYIVFGNSSSSSQRRETRWNANKRTQFELTHIYRLYAQDVYGRRSGQIRKA